MNDDISILVVDDHEEVLLSIKKILLEAKYIVYTSDSGSYALEVCRNYNIDIVISDIVMPKMNGIELLKKLKQYDKSIKVLMLTGFATVESSIEAMKQGAFSYLLKPFNVEEILAEISKLSQVIRLEKENITYKEEAKSYIYHSYNPEMKEIFNLIKNKIAQTDATLLLSGESGTGKEIIAHMTHNCSHRSHGPFIKVDCSALSENLVESEMFGHTKGAFTGAFKSKQGRFEIADKGTIFLDEIGELSLYLQLKLLRVLQEKIITRVGSNKEIKIDVRIIVATNKNLKEMVLNKSFREDLFYRINVMSINLPPLRERIEDIPMLVDAFIKKYSKKNNIVVSKISEEVMKGFLSYYWPGNIRELENVIERAVILSDEGVINTVHVENYILSKLNTSFCTLKEAKYVFEKEYLYKILKICNYNVSKTSKILGITRKNVYLKLKKYNIHLK